ncbi:HTH domain-containing protein [Streptococcus ratti]|uniref:HTH domain-containing protein n=1 Tax=Streptococcus ratti TaxID=1341 RepID=UPI0002BF27CE|nr:HTH domain-containing protein [Streptococcus ratti]EMP69696.1 transcriptional regulator [Streptococcus ratti FA-1 = DSM 20564]QEY07844.1 HTH domain-containing protein [Streptococcus ratti]VEI60314.1 transcriptional regulator [Streptococcus mutans]
MLLTKREEQLLKAFQGYGKLSIKQIADLLKVSQRTVYRVISDLTKSLSSINISIIKEDRHYFLVGELENLADFHYLDNYEQYERLNLITYKLLLASDSITNEQLQADFKVSNVTIIQDIAEIEKRLADFDVYLERNKGYQLLGGRNALRRLLAVLLTNNISVSDFWTGKYGHFTDIGSDKLETAKQIFQASQTDLPDLDAKMCEFFIILLALSGWQDNEAAGHNISKAALDFSQKIYTEFSKETNQFYSIQEILYYASVLDELVIKRQETPLFHEKFDSAFFYNISNLIDKVSLYTKINFAKDKTLFHFLFNHIRLNLAVPQMFEDKSNIHIAHEVVQKNEHLHRVVSLLVQDIFPKYLQRESEYELITLHFASSLRRSPDIYPIRILLLTDERPLARELLITRIKTIAPFVDKIVVKTLAQYQDSDQNYYNCVLATNPVKEADIKVISIYPNTKEMVQLQDYLQEVQAHQKIILRNEKTDAKGYNLQNYFLATQQLLREFSYQMIDNPVSFEMTVPQVVDTIDAVSDKSYLADKLLRRFAVSPLAIPETNLALLHTQSSKVETSCFKIYDLKNPVTALSMNYQEEKVSRILVMLTRLDESQEMRDLMTAISQSIIENHLYTEIYKTGNKDIIYQLLNQIFTEKIKKLET